MLIYSARFAEMSQKCLQNVSFPTLTLIMNNSMAAPKTKNTGIYL